MSFDRTALAAAVKAHGCVARVVIADIKGSSPREVGASMLVWNGGQSGTIGGGALEFEATKSARGAIRPFRITHHALGPELGQCCGGVVSLVTETFDATRLRDVPTTGLYARGIGSEPLSVTRVVRQARAGGDAGAGLFDGWMVEPLSRDRASLWIWGAGHVGRALVDVLAPLPELALTWVDDAPGRFPDDAPPQVRVLPAPEMPRAMALAPTDGHHLILTYSHEIDLALCHAALQRGFRTCGVIGSKTKWARFRKRLRGLGHSDTQMARVTCPIGEPALGKHPHAIAIGVGQDLLLRVHNNAHHQDAEGQHYDHTASDT